MQDTAQDNNDQKGAFQIRTSWGWSVHTLSSTRLYRTSFSRLHRNNSFLFESHIMVQPWNWHWHYTFQQTAYLQRHPPFNSSYRLPIRRRLHLFVIVLKQYITPVNVWTRNQTCRNSKKSYSTMANRELRSSLSHRYYNEAFFRFN